MNAALETPDRSEADADSRAVRRRPTPAARAALAVAGAGLVLVAGRLLAGAVTPIEIAFEGVARLLGVPWVFNLVHALPADLDRLAKPVLFAVVVVGWTTVAWWLARRARPWAARVGRTRLVAAGVALSVALPGLVLLPAQGLGLFGLSPANLAWDPVRLHLLAALAGFVWAAVAVGGAAPRGAVAGRRDVVALVLRGGVATWAVTTVGGRWLAARAQEIADLFGRVVGLSARITPTEDHYTVSKNLFAPNVRERGWTLRIVGQVERELELTLADLRALPSVTRPSTLMCVSNTVGGDLIGTSEWTGVRLADLLEAAGVRPGANELVLRAADNYSDSFPLEDAVRDGTIVAYLQNGEPLTAAHGFPARVLVPGIYGMKNVKWVQEIELTDEDHLGYWQVRGWSDVATVKTMSRIDTERATRLDDGRVAVGGIAYAGLRGVAGVEVSLDDGATWTAARVEPAPNELSWVRWVAVLETRAARFDLRVRAIEPDGTVQTDQRTRPLPDGADGHHQVRIDVPG
jgi:DMSO/TMAO reductase YedYZ molybdopterin-dependent catalytic subunit